MYDNGCFFTKNPSQALSGKEEDQEAFYVLSVRPGSGSYGCAGVVFRMGLLRRNQPQAIFSVIIGLTIKVYQLVGTRWVAEGSTARARCGGCASVVIVPDSNQIPMPFFGWSGD